MGNYRGATVVDDYGHHPTEIRATLRALREKYRPGRLLCAFQPHQASRTRLLLDDFATAFTDADLTLLADIYFVRDSADERTRISSEILAARIRSNGQDVQHIPDFADILKFFQREARPGDLICTMGAGNVWEIGRDLVDLNGAQPQA